MNGIWKFIGSTLYSLVTDARIDDDLAVSHKPLRLRAVGRRLKNWKL